MAEFIITSTDSSLTYTSTLACGIEFDIQNNNKVADTQGYFRKVLKGVNRVGAVVQVPGVSASDLDTFMDMQVYNDNFNVTLDRNIPTKGTTQDEFTLESVKIIEELPDTEYVVELILTEVVS